MSRSYKHNPGFTGGKMPDAKRFANKKVRKIDPENDVQDGKWYKKLYCSWNICDYKFLDIRRLWGYKSKMK
jgi:hypothetical protein